jgi:hypothetical protein
MNIGSPLPLGIALSASAVLSGADKVQRNWSLLFFHEVTGLINSMG